MIVLRELAPAKVNLYLHVTGKRADGYHELDSLTAFADVGDKLEYRPSDTLSCCLAGPFSEGVSPTANVVMKVAEALRDQFRVKAGASLTLHKHIPVGAGLGGGSADAGAALRLLSRVWKISPTPKALHSLALSIGADVPACLRSHSLYMSGIGDTIEAGPPLSGVFIVMIWPGKALLTRDVFAQIKKTDSSAGRHPNGFANLQACVEFLGKQKNDMQPAAITLCPEIKTTLAALQEERECLLARMSGSGSACFGIFATMELARAAAEKLAARHTGWWVKAATLR